ncbi:MAG: ribosomal-protein-alanine N-acetyltransferase [Maribacter sp.]|jgi:ribosomal-protein-alanine N-acetyltransferase
MIIFQTKSLVVKKLEEKDEDFFIELLSKPEIIDLIPQPIYPLKDVLDNFNYHKNLEGEILDHKKIVWGIFEKGNSDMIGLCLFLTNDENDRELGYRFRVEYWRKGYGTEITKGIIDFSFNELKLDKITADVNVANTASVKILEKFLHLKNEFYNERDKCLDRRYEIKKEDWK